MNDRPDIELARDKQEGIKKDNYWANFNKPIPEQPFAKDESGLKVSEIVKSLVKKGGGRALYYNHQIFWDMDLLQAREEACLDCIIPEGWDDALTGLEQINVEGNNKGHEYEILVEIYSE